MTPGKHSPLLIPSTPVGVEGMRRGRHPIGLVYIRQIAGNPGSSALRASSPVLCRTDPYGVQHLIATQAKDARPTTDRLRSDTYQMEVSH